jgi:hypothetical protein
VMNGEAAMETRTYGPIFDALAERPHKLGELLDLPEVRGSSLQPVELAAVLAATQQALPLVPDAEAADPAPARRFNTALGRRIRDEASFRDVAIASPLIGTGVSVNTAGLAAHHALATGCPPDAPLLAERVWDVLSARGETVVKDGKPVIGAAPSIALLVEKIKPVLQDTLPIWKKLKTI